jgi:hypothetical protein
LNEVVKENEQLRQEVARLGKALYDKKGKAKQIQPPQDNTAMGVNKPMEGETVICRLCQGRPYVFPMQGDDRE